MGRQYIGIEQMDYIEDIAVKRMQKVIGETVKKDGELLEKKRV
jgi:adenine-specific DNA-methyltransferase